MKSIYNSYGFLLAKANQKLVEHIEPLLAVEGLTPKHTGLLFIINEQDGINQKEAATIQQVDRTTMTQLVDYLEKKSLVKRVPKASDRRAYGLHLTESGKKTVTKLWQYVKDSQNATFKDLTPEQINTLKEILTIIVKEN